MEPGGCVLGAAVSEGVRLTASEICGPGDSWGFFLRGGAERREPAESVKNKEVFYYLNAAPEWQARSLERKQGVGGGLPIQRGLLCDTLKRSTESGRKVFS
jgi:hypothetical protein